MGNNCSRRKNPNIIIQTQIKDNEQDENKICLKHKIQLTHLCLEEQCISKENNKLCRKCIIHFHKNHQIEEINHFNHQINENCSHLSSLSSNIRKIKNFQNMQTTSKDLIRPFLVKLNYNNIINNNSNNNNKQQYLMNERQQPHKIEESIRLKLQRTANKIYIEQDRQQTYKEDVIIDCLENIQNLSFDPQRQNLLANFQFSSTYNEMINFNIYQSSKQMNRMTQSYNPYKFDYNSFTNSRKTMLIIQKDLKYMKLKTCCRIDQRYAAIHFRNHLNESDFYIIDLIDENIVYIHKHIPSHNTFADFNYLYKISYLGNYFICFNFITYIVIKDFKTIIQNNLYHNTTKISNNNNNNNGSGQGQGQQQSQQYQEFSWFQRFQQGNTYTFQYNLNEQQQYNRDRQIKSIKIIPNNLVFSVDKVKSGELCLMEQQSEQFIEIRDYSIWNFKKKQCIRTLNITGHYVYDIFNNYIVLECSFHTFTLFNWKTNQIHKSYSNIYPFLSKFNAKADSEQYYDIQAVKIFAIQKLLTTKDDTFLNSQPSFEDWLQSLPFQYKSMIIFEDTWLFKYDRTAIIMLKESLLIYDMNQNIIVKQLELKIPSDQISFIWQAGNKLVYITKEGLFLFYS